MKRRNNLAALLAGLSLTVVFAACKKDDKKKEVKNANPPVTKPAPKPTPVAQVPAVGGAEVDAVMKSYEACRLLLATDKADVAACAKATAEAARKGQAQLPESARAHAGALATAADALAKVPAKDIAKVRLAFGEVSKAIVAMLIAAPAAAKKYHVFECPMAKGYKRWAQPTAKLHNPYMGSRMPSCGSEVHDHHMGGKGMK